ncbi:TPA: trypsin-like peptidase domain-containing protein [Candidatus Woesearchaeota archaeon]|nr:trypsin-like peptidase domain-containing protein [Candidatus Woesearchaeota archaeon]
MIFCSCTRVYIDTKPNIPFDSFVQIKAKRYKANCITCLLETGFGSGTVVGSNKILTAGHICAGVREMLNNAAQSEVLDKVLVTVHEHKENIYAAIELDIHPSKDICLMTTDRTLLADPIPIASKSPSRGKVVWSMMAPDGVAGKGLIPVVSGHFAGGDSLMSVFTIPAYPGSSGAPILNIAGEIIGLVSRINKGFHHIVISPSRRSLRDFIFSFK